MRVKLIREYQGAAKGTVLNLPRNQGNLLIKRGLAILAKDMTSQDYKLTSDEVQADGRHTFIRTHN